ncbi:plasmid pRiA4b ORF-3 family protein [Lacticaseibacillus sp. N501-2]|uniref:plasmid pRiA4b ORF-3 family protein n=1 Tax=Lacticaseibacillus salsurae TaxID=3367729 RepID=UPI0038B272DE
MTKALILKITLEHRRPLTWRRLAVPADLTYTELHQVIQAAFGWDNYHLYAFYPAWNRSLTYEDLSLDDGSGATDAATAQILPDLKKGTVQYTYDFGESWDHRIQLEATREMTGMLPICLAGRGGGFYEDGLGVREEEFDVDAVNNDLADSLLTDSEMLDTVQTQLKNVVTQDLTTQLALFERSSQRAEMSDVPSNAISVYVHTLVMVMQDLPLKKWTKTKLEKGLDQLFTQLADDDEDSQHLMAIIIGDFLQVMAAHSELAPSMTPEKVEDLMGQVIMENGLMPDDDFDDQDSTYHHVMQIVDNNYGHWIQPFLQSTNWTDLHFDDHISAVNLILSFVANMFDSYETLIEDWHPVELSHMMLDYYPNSMLISDAEAQALPKLVVAFVEFLHTQKQLNAKPTKRIVKTIQNNASLMAKRCADPDMWGEGKKLGMQMQTAGVDTDDPAAMYTYLEGQLHGVSSQGVPPVPFADDLKHVETCENRHWRQGTATRVHNDAEKFAWAATQNFDVQRLVVDFADTVYAKYLLTPMNWREDIVSAVWTQHLDKLHRAQCDALASGLIKYLQVLGDATSMSKTQASRLSAIIDKAPGQTKKVVPFKPRG